MDLAEALLQVHHERGCHPECGASHPRPAPSPAPPNPASRHPRSPPPPPRPDERVRPNRPPHPPADMRLLDRSQQSSSESGDASRSLGALRDLLPALSALAPTGGPQLINTLTRWYQRQARTLASSSGDRNPLGRSRTLQLAFWHAAHRVLAPLPPAPSREPTSPESSTSPLTRSSPGETRRRTWTPAGAPGPWQAALRIRRRTLRITMRVGASTRWRAGIARWRRRATPRSTRRRRRWTLAVGGGDGGARARFRVAARPGRGDGAARGGAGAEGQLGEQARGGSPHRPRREVPSRVVGRRDPCKHILRRQVRSTRRLLPDLLGPFFPRRTGTSRPRRRRSQAEPLRVAPDVPQV